MRPDRPSDLNIRALLTTAAFAVAAGVISGCGGSAAPAQPVYGGGGHPTPTPHATPTPTVGPSGAPTATPTPPPSGGVAAACVLTLAATNKTYAFVPAFSSADSSSVPDSLAEVTIANGTTIASHLRTAGVQRTRHFHRINVPQQRGSRRPAFTVTAGTAVSPIITYTPPPAECAASAPSTLYLMSNGSYYTPSNIVSVVNVNASTAAMTFNTNFTTDANSAVTYSGGEFDILGIVYDSKQAGVIIATTNGYETYSGTTPYAKINQITGNPSENFGYNSATEQIFSPTYGSYPSDLGLGTITGLAYYTNSAEPAGIDDPDSAAVDSVTNIGVAPEEFEQAVYLVNLGAATISGTTYSAPTSTLDISGPLVTGIVEQTDAGLTDTAIDSTAHLAFMAGEYGTTGFCVVALPTTAGTGAPTASDYACATFPTTPDTNEFNSPFDPHATSTFDLGGKAYGLMFNSEYSYVAVIDLAAMMAAPRDPSDPHAVTSASALGAIVSYVPI
jgi:hypothetical protein